MNNLQSLKKADSRIVFIGILFLYFIFQIPYLLYSIPYGYDEALFWQTILLMNDGHKLYQDIFYAHPPLFMNIARIFYNVFSGITPFFGPRLCVVLFSLILILSLASIARHLFDKKWGLLTLLVATFTPGVFLQSHKFSGDVPSIALSTAALSCLFFYRERKNTKFIYASALLFALSLQFKLVSAPMLIPLLFFTPKTKNRILFLGTAAAFSLLFIASTGYVFPQFLYQLQGGSFVHFWDSNYLAVQTKQSFYYKITQTLKFGAPLSVLYLPALFFISSPAVLKVWFAAGVLAILVHTPVWYHHFLILTPIQVLLFICLCHWLTEKYKSKKARAYLSTAAVLFLASNIFLITLLGFSIHKKRLAEWESQYSRLENQLGKIFKPHSLVISDEYFMISKLNLRVPPQVSDTSFVRTSTKSLTCKDLDSIVSKQNVQGLIVGERLQRMDCLSDPNSLLVQKYRKTLEVSDISVYTKLN